MGLLKVRPEISVFAPNVLARDEPVSARVVLDCAEAVPVDELMAELVCTGVYWTRQGFGRTTGPRQAHELEIWRAVSRPVTDALELPKGRHEYLVQFEIPPDLPPTYDGIDLQIRWSIRVRADIPWWPDAKANFVMNVPPAKAAGDAGGPMVYTSSETGPVGKKPYAEISLGEAVGGEVLRGKVALSNTAHNEYKSIEFTLMAIESASVWWHSQKRSVVRGRWSYSAEGIGENETIPFGIVMPDDLVPAFETRRFELQWSLEVRLDVDWAIDERLWIPLRVRAGHSERGEETAAPKAVGSDRLAHVWSNAGRDAGYNFAAGELTREAGSARLVVRREHRGRKGLRLLAEASYPNLDLGLTARKGRLRLRDAGQSKVMSEHTDALTQPLKLEFADDERLRIWVDDAGIRGEPVGKLAGALLELWTAVERARQELPPPADMADAVPAFRSAARRLGGELDVGSMDIRGSRFEIPFALELQWGRDGNPACHGADVRAPGTPDRRALAPRLAAGRAAAGDSPRGSKPSSRARGSLSIDAERIRIAFPACGAEVERYVERLEALLEVARRLSGHGPGLPLSDCAGRGGVAAARCSDKSRW